MNTQRKTFSEMTTPELKQFLDNYHKTRKYNLDYKLANRELANRECCTRKPTHIIGKRWFRKSYGNTYNSVTIYFDDGSSEYLPESYGYDDYYLRRAEVWIKANFEYPNPDKLQGTRFLREVCGITWSVTDVSRQMDL